MLRKTFPGRRWRGLHFGVPLILLLTSIVILSSCTDRDDPARHAGAPATPPKTNAMEGSPSGRGVSPATGPKMTFSKEPITNVSQISSGANASALESQSVRLSGVPVKRVLSNQYVIVGGESDPGVLVRLKELLPGLKPGHSVNISGMIAQLGEDLAHWELDPDEKKAVREYSVFINATHSEMAGQRDTLTGNQ